MSNKLKIVLGVIVVLLVAGLVGWSASHSKSFGNTAYPQNCGGSVTCFTDLSVGNAYTNLTAWLGGSTDITARQQQVTSGTCNAGFYAASSTLFAVL